MKVLHRRHDRSSSRTGSGWASLAVLLGSAVLLMAGCSTPPATNMSVATQPAMDDSATRAARIDALTGESVRMVVDGRYAEAQIALDELLELDPTNAYAGATRKLISERNGAIDSDEAAVEALLEKQPSEPLAFDSVPLSHAIAEVARVYGTTFDVDWKALEAAGIEKSSMVSFKVSQLKFPAAIDRLAAAVSTPPVIAFTTRDGQVVISTESEVARNVVTRVYDVRDLVLSVPNFAQSPDFNLQAGGGGGGGGLFGGGGGSGGYYPGNYDTGRMASGGPVGGKPVPQPARPAAPPAQSRVHESAGKTREEMVEDVVRLTQDTIAPDTWRDVGGSIGSIRELNGQLIVTQTPEHHRAMVSLLRNLRRPEVIGQPVGPQQPPPPPPPEPVEPFNTEAYDLIVENDFLRVTDNPLSTFSIDVDTASYSNVRRFLTGGQLPPPDAVRIEELVNYFTYDYQPPPAAEAKPGEPANPDAAPFSAAVEVSACPWDETHRLVRIGLKGREIPKADRPPSNLVFLIDVSGSMESPNKLPLVKQSLQILIEQLTPKDRVALGVYASSSGMVLESTAADAAGKRALRDAIDQLEAGGSTNGGEGIEMAYAVAAKNKIKDGINRVILCTDGDFNVGITDQGQLTRLIEDQAKGGVFLSALGFGMGNYKDSTMELLADKGNGNYAYIDTLNEARKVLAEQMSGTLITIAKDVKIQVEFNPAVAGAYRLIGYENRMLAKEDFNNDKKDAGEIGAGHAVTALYEVVPAGVAIELPNVDALKYQKPAGDAAADKAKLAIEEARTDLALKQLALKRAEQASSAKNGSATDGAATEDSDIAVEEAKLAVKLAEIRLKQVAPDAKPANKELLTLKLRYKQPDGDKSRLLEFPIEDGAAGFDKATGDFKFASAVASFGMTLRGSKYAGKTSFDAILKWAQEGKGADASGYRTEFIELVKKAQALRKNNPAAAPAADAVGAGF